MAHIVICVKGGMVTEVLSDLPENELQLKVLDFDAAQIESPETAEAVQHE